MKFNQDFTLPAPRTISISIAAALLSFASGYALPETTSPMAFPSVRASASGLAAPLGFPSGTLALDMTPPRLPVEAWNCVDRVDDRRPESRIDENSRGRIDMASRLEALKASLNLNSQQAALWETARKATIPALEARKTHRDRMKARHDRLLVALSDPASDPRTLAAEMDREQAETQTRLQATRKLRRDAWFAVYDSLDAGQRSQVREFLRARLEQMGEPFQMRHRARGRPETLPGDHDCSTSGLPRQT